MQRDKPLINLQTTITLLVCFVVALSLLVTDVLISAKIEENTRQNLADKATNIAKIIAKTPLVISGLEDKQHEEQIQDFANEIRTSTDVEFIVVMNMQRIRKSHPNQALVGLPFVGGDERRALLGEEYTSVAQGTLGMSLRAFSPVFADGGVQVGAVAVGISLNNVQQAVARSRIITIVGIGVGSLVGVVGAMILARKIKKTLFGLEPYAIAKLLKERSAVLESVREGVLAVDQNSRVTLVNAEAVRLFKRAGVTGEMIGRQVEEIVPNTRMVDVLETGKPQLNYEQDLNGITLFTNRVPVTVQGRVVGAVATFRDKTELKVLAEQLTGVRNYAEALRAQAHEFMNKLHVILGLVHMQNYDKLLEFVKQIANQQQAEVGFVVRQIKDPVLAGFILGKLSYAREVGAELELQETGYLPEPEDAGIIHELITIIGNLVDNALDAVQSSDHKGVGLNIVFLNDQLTITVTDQGSGISNDIRNEIFEKGFSTKQESRGYGLFLVKTHVEKLQGNINLISETGKGTSFVVVIPYKSKDEQH